MNAYKIDMGYGDGWEDFTTVLDAMRTARVFTVKNMGDGRFRLREGCDRYFFAMLSGEQLAALGRELIVMSEGGGK